MIKIIASSFLKNETLLSEIKSHFPDVVLYAGPDNHLPALHSFCADAEVLLVGREIINDEFLDFCPNIKLIAKYGVGIDNIDLDALQKRNILLGWTGGVNKRSVAELTIGFLLSAAHNTFITGNKLKNGTWYKNGGVCLENKTLGIIGFGNIGSEVAKLLQAFNMRIIAHDIVNKSAEAKALNVELCSLSHLQENADFISLHVPYTPQTKSFINAHFLENCKPNMILINCARGEIVHTQDIIDALQNQQLAGYYADAFDPEPYANPELISQDTFYGTPHIGGNSTEAALNMGRSAIQHIIQFYQNS